MSNILIRFTTQQRSYLSVYTVNRVMITLYFCLCLAVMSRRSSRLVSGGYYNSDEESDSSSVTNISYRENPVKYVTAKPGLVCSLYSHSVMSSNLCPCPLSPGFSRRRQETAKPAPVRPVEPAAERVYPALGLLLLLQVSLVLEFHWSDVTRLNVLAA